jgi:tetratricopeptide (TPR) repeat protein
MLERGMVRADPENNPYPALLAQTNVIIYDALTYKGDAPIEQRLAHLRQALAYVTDYRPALGRMAQLVMQPGEAGQDVETMLNRMIAEGKMPATGHFALGTKAWNDEETDKALWHLERAYELEPNLGHIGNNLAWMLADQNPPDLDRALKIIDSVLESFPNIATFHDTKGYILMKRGEWEQSLTELEIALPKMRDNIELHRSLATVYRKLGKPSLADEHERIIQELEKAARIAKETSSEELFNPELLKDSDSNPEKE